MGETPKLSTVGVDKVVNSAKENSNVFVVSKPRSQGNNCLDESKSGRNVTINDTNNLKYSCCDRRDNSGGKR